MPDGEAGGLVGLDQREGGARRFRFGAGEAADQGAGQRGLAGAEIAVQRDDVARPGVRARRSPRAAVAASPASWQGEGPVRHFEALYHACFRAATML